MVFLKYFLIIIFFYLKYGLAYSCTIPVFRYALERWEPDRYELYVFSNHASDLSDVERIALSNPHANVSIKFINPDSVRTGLEMSVWNEVKELPFPSIALRYPYIEAKSGIIWTAEYSLENVRKIYDSPVRRKMFSLAKEDISAVWVLLETGDSAKDQRTAELIKNQFPVSIKKAEETRLEEAPLNITAEYIPFSFSFELVRISRSDPAESAFIEMLLASEQDLRHYEDEPIVFPVYGRGRLLYALVGQGINEKNVDIACLFLTGPCSCEIKSEYPGMDMLVSADWGSLVKGITSEEKPALVGISHLATVSSPAIIFPAPTSEDTVYIEDKAVENLLIRNQNMVGFQNHIKKSILLTFFIMGMGVLAVTGTYIHFKKDRGKKI